MQQEFAEIMSGRSARGLRWTMAQRILNYMASLSFFMAALLHVFFVYKTSPAHIDISFVVTSKSVYSYFVIYSINLIIFYAIVSLLKIFIGLSLGGRRFFYIDISSFIFGYIAIFSICVARGIPVF
ncbi:hypothetical protein BBJ66_18810 [Rhizobium sp. RSm-3]|nr:hypothetical protein BBJ66_18810 [Rhizobium sp. RSm-3]